MRVMAPGLVKLHCFLAHRESFLFYPLIEMSFENPELVVTEDPSAALLGVEEPYRSSAHGHLAGLPVRHTTHPTPHAWNQCSRLG
jgi:hypothetical protein